VGRSLTFADAALRKKCQRTADGMVPRSEVSWDAAVNAAEINLHSTRTRSQTTKAMGNATLAHALFVVIPPKSSLIASGHPAKGL